MEIYKLEYIKFEEDFNNEIYFLGYFSTYEHILKAIELYENMPGFIDKPNNFEIKVCSLDKFEMDGIVFDVNIYFHNMDFSIEYFHCLGVFSNEVLAKNSLSKYESLNKERIIKNTLIYESFINKHILDQYNLSEGFNSN